MTNSEAFKTEWEAEVVKKFGPKANPVKIALIEIIMHGERARILTDEELEVVIHSLGAENEKKMDATLAPYVKNALGIAIDEQCARAAATKSETTWWANLNKVKRIGLKNIPKGSKLHHWLLTQRRAVQQEEAAKKAAFLAGTGDGNANSN